MTYPESSPKHGEQYLWITLDERAMERSERQRLSAAADDALPSPSSSKAKGRGAFERNKQEYPPGVSVDNSGNVFVADGHVTPKKITSEDIMATFYVTEPPAAPVLASTRPESISIRWDSLIGLPDRFELQYRVAMRAEVDLLDWACSQCSFDNVPGAVTCEVRARSSSQQALAEGSALAITALSTVPGRREACCAHARLQHSPRQGSAAPHEGLEMEPS